jgi:hypothetical protein
MRHSPSLPTLALAAAVLALPAGRAAAEPAAVEATGEAAITGNRSLARERAVEDALRNAVAQAAATLVSGEARGHDAQLVSDRILTGASGYVQSHEVLETRQDGRAIRVRVRAVVGLDRLAGDLAAIGLTLASRPGQLDGGTRLTLRVAGVDTQGVLNALVGALRERVRGVKDVQPRRFGGGSAELDVGVTGTVQAFASALGEQAVKGRRVEVTGLSDDAVELRLVR